MGTSIDNAIADIIKRFGAGAVQFAEDTQIQPVDVIPTGSLALDLALGVGGIPRGRITEIFGPEMSGKTTICQHIIAEVQKMGGLGVFIDMEHALDLSYASHCGIDIKKMVISQPDYGEQALEIAETLIRSGNVTVVIIDSVAALVPRAEIDGDMGSSPMGMQARLMSQAMRKLSGITKTTNTAVIFTNQLRQKIGVIFGNPEVTPGGLALKFYASVRLDTRRIKLLKSGSDVIGSRSRVRVVKNKVAPPFRVAEFDIMYNKGISREGDLLDLGVQFGLISKRGSYYYYDQTKLGQGRENAKDYLKDDSLLSDKIDSEIRSASNTVEMPLSLGADEENEKSE